MSEIDIIGKKFGRLVAIMKDRSKTGDGGYWFCECECGEIASVRGRYLRSGKTKSCGCYGRGLLRSNGYRHGMCKSPEYNAWAGMKNRCKNKNSSRWSDYGGRGITYDKRWEKFINFFNDMGERTEGESLDRIDNSKGYFKENCKWSTPSEQQNNRRINHTVQFNGEIKTVSQWARSKDINISTLSKRLARGWDIDRALNTTAEVRGTEVR